MVGDLLMPSMRHMNNACFHEPINYAAGFVIEHDAACLLCLEHPSPPLVATSTHMRRRNNMMRNDSTTRLEHAKECSDNAHKAGGTCDLESAGSAGASGRPARAGTIAVTAVGAGRKSAAPAGLLLGASAGVGTLDNVVRAGKGLEVVAGIADILGGLEVEGTTDIHKLRQLNTELIVSWD